MTTQAINISQEPTSHDARVGERVMMLMFRARISQTAFAARMGITQTALSKKVHGERKWSLNDLYAAADALGTTVPVILGFESPTSTADPNMPPSDYKATITRIADYRARRAA